MGSTTSAPAAPESDAQSSSSPAFEVQDRDFSPIVSVGVWSRLNAFGRFHNDGIEAAFRVYAATEWAASFPRWILATAIAFTVAPIFDIFTLLLGAPESAWAPHSSVRPTFYSIAVLMWLATFGLRFLVRSDFLERCAKYQQPIIIAVTGGAACGVTFPVIMMSAEGLRETFKSSTFLNSEYLDGHWRCALASAGCALLACSGATPTVFLAVSGYTFSLFAVRNHMLRLALRDVRAAAERAEAAPSQMMYRNISETDLLITSEMHFIPVLLVCLLICMQRDRALRQHFGEPPRWRGKRIHDCSALLLVARESQSRAFLMARVATIVALDSTFLDLAWVLT